MHVHRTTLAALAFAGLALASTALAADPDYTFEARDGAIAGPQEVAAGYATVAFDNADAAPHMLMLARLRDGVTLEQVQGAMQEGPDAAFEILDLAGGFGPTMPGAEAVITFGLAEPGSYVGIDMMSGALAPFEVVEAEGAPAERPEADLVVRELDFGYDIPAEVPAGEQVWEVVNVGQEPHELILFRLADGVTIQDFAAALEANPEGEPPAEMVGGVMPMAVGYTNFVTLDLAPGDYVAWCFIPSPAHDHAPHFALGMAVPFTVVEAVAGG